VRQKTQDSDLLRYVPSRAYLARIRVGGKLIRRSLESTVLSAVKLKLADLEKKERTSLENKHPGLPFAQSFGFALLPGMLEHVGSALTKPFGDKFVKPGFLLHPWSQLHRQRALANPGSVDTQWCRFGCELGEAFASRAKSLHTMLDARRCFTAAA
jgi:hypothetical protein